MVDFNSFQQASAFFGAQAERMRVESVDRAALNIASAYLLERVWEKFGVYQDAAGPFAAWADLKPRTMVERVDQGYSANEPLLRTGTLSDNTDRMFDSREAVVGVWDRVVQHPYGQPVNIGDVAMDLEIGTFHMEPRSFLAAAAWEHAEKIAELIGRDIFFNMFTNHGRVREPMTEPHRP